MAVETRVRFPVTAFLWWSLSGGFALTPGKMDDEGFEPSTFRMQNGRSTTELNAPRAESAASSCSVVVSTPDFESGNPGSNPGGSAVWQSKSFRHRELNPGLLGEGQVF